MSLRFGFWVPISHTFRYLNLVPGSFNVYIDESGEEGFKFLPNNKGSSRWLVLSALMIRDEKDLWLVEAAGRLRSQFGKPADGFLHFVDLDHAKRVVWAKTIGQGPIKLINVLVHKESIDPTGFVGTNRLYWYACRLLLERVSRIARDAHARNPTGDGVVNLIFSHRRKMSYGDFKEYIALLKKKENTSIIWPHIDPERIEAHGSRQRAGLQMVDAAAGAAYHAVTLDRYGNNEPRYILEMKSKIHSHNGTCIGSGLKFWPDLAKIKPSKPHLCVFDGF